MQWGIQEVKKYGRGCILKKYTPEVRKLLNWSSFVMVFQLMVPTSLNLRFKFSPLHENWLPSLKLTANAPEKGCLEYETVSFSNGRSFQGHYLLLVSGYRYLRHKPSFDPPWAQPSWKLLSFSEPSCHSHHSMCRSPGSFGQVLELQVVGGHSWVEGEKSTN